MIPMRPTASAPSRAVCALLAAAVVSVVLGILGMHALNTHGVMSNTDHVATSGAASSPLAGSYADMSVAPAIGNNAGVTTTVPTTVPGRGNVHNMGDMVMLCVVMLVAAAGWLLLGLRRIPRVWAHLPVALDTVTTWVTSRRGTGPPPAWEFSVIRC